MRPLQKSILSRKMRKIIGYFIRFDVAVNVIILAFVVFGIVVVVLFLTVYGEVSG